MQQKDTIWVANAQGGLANQLRALISVMRISEEQPYFVNWVQGQHNLGRFSDLFKNKLELSRQTLNLYKDRISYYSSPAFMVLESDQLPVTAPFDKKRTIDAAYKYVPTQLKEAYVTTLKHLIPSETVASKVKAISKEFNSGTVSIHARTWYDYKKNYLSLWEKIGGIQAYFDLMDKMEDKKFFVSTDDPRVLTQMEKRYPGRIILNPSQSNQGVEPMVDLYLLSQNPVMILSRGSTFGSLAWWFGGAKAQVYTAGGEEERFKLLNPAEN